MKHKKVLLFVVLIPPVIFIPLKPVFTGSNPISAQPARLISGIKDTGTLGSMAYVSRIRLFAVKYGDNAALQKIMSDVDKNAPQIDKNSYEDNRRLYKIVSYYVGKIGSVDMRTHYFRNKLNRAPRTLDELLLQNERLPADKRWKLLSVQASLYHIQGRDGIYNLKFISSDGFCEAVYNKSGVLLTEKNDPVNMGTFNYAAGINQLNAHEKYDVTPYLKWGNTPDSPQKGYSAIQKGVNEATALYNQNISSVTAYRKKAAASILRKT